MGAGVLDARGDVKAVQRYESDSAAITHLAFYAGIPAAISASGIATTTFASEP